MKRRTEILTIQNLHAKINTLAYTDKRVWQICIREEAIVKKRAFLALILVLTLCASVGHAALVQVGGEQQQKGLALTTATPQPTQAPPPAAWRTAAPAIRFSSFSVPPVCINVLYTIQTIRYGDSFTKMKKRTQTDNDAGCKPSEML